MNCAASDDLIEQYFCQIWGINGAPCAYLMQENAQVLPPSPSLDEYSEAELFEDQMIRYYPIVKPIKILGNITSVYGEPFLNIMYTCKATEVDAHCFQELKGVVQGTEAEVYMDKFNVYLEFCAAWRKLYNTFLRSDTWEMLAFQLEQTIQNL